METPSNVAKLPALTGVAKGPRRPKKHAEDDGEAWLVSYADMVTLLFCFLVILLSVSKVDVSRMSGMKAEMDKTFSEAASTQKSLDDLQGQLQAVVDKVGLSNQVRVRSTGRGLQLDLNAKILFAPGSAELSPGAMDLLDQLAGPLGRESIQMVVEGHTDPLPIRSQLYPSNWELSASRASSVVRYLITALKYRPERLQAVGMADTRPMGPDGELLEKAPVSDYWSDEYLARQRRVTMVVTPMAVVVPKAAPGQKVETTGKAGTVPVMAPGSASTEPFLAQEAAAQAKATANVQLPGTTAPAQAVAPAVAPAQAAAADPAPPSALSAGYIPAALVGASAGYSGGYDGEGAAGAGQSRAEPGKKGKRGKKQAGARGRASGWSPPGEGQKRPVGAKARWE